MDMKRFEQFKRESNILIETSVWLTGEMDKIVKEQAYYEEHPHLDTYDLMDQRIRLMDELQQRAIYEDKNYLDHKTKYTDLFNLDW